jgi:hypothetical protein
MIIFYKITLALLKKHSIIDFMETKLSKLKALYLAGDIVGAMRITAQFPNLGAEREAIRTAWDARQSPSLYRQMKHDPDLLWNAGVSAMVAKYHL